VCICKCDKCEGQDRSHHHCDVIIAVDFAIGSMEAETGGSESFLNCVCSHACVYVHVCACVWGCLYVPMHVCMCLCVCICMCACMYVNAYACACPSETLKSIHSRTHTYTHNIKAVSVQGTG